ncbi:MAG: hypothetical protein PHS44_03250 [Candidatus Dojkabacteria bacterium]|nr:hypothetical protein [Candidatus Dojkabacteria bacterium]
MIDGPEPTISAKEYRISRGASSLGLIKVTSGKVKLTDLHGLGNPKWQGVSMDIEPGKYLVKMFLLEIPDKFTKYVAILCRTNGGVLDEVEFEQLE